MSLLPLALVGLVALGLVVLVTLLLLPATLSSMQRVRIEREAQQASWRIHQRAVAAFAELLEAAREERQ